MNHTFLKCGRLRGIIAISALLWAAIVQAKLIEQVIKVPVVVTNGYGREFSQDIVVTVFVDDATPTPRPVAIIGHGRAVTPQERAAVGRRTEITNARWFAQLGFVVAVPTRMGYGVSGGEDVEDTGTCNRKNYPPGYEVAAQQTLRTLDAVRALPGVSPDRAVVIGQSFGGATAITVAAKNPTGIQLTINFAGGGGGNPATQAQEPCGVSQLKRMFADYGKTARIPTLWVYTENDQWMGPKYPREWFDAFKAAGGVGEFSLFPPLGDDGHGMFSKAPEIWRARVLSFMQVNGYPLLGATGAQALTVP